MRKNIGLIFDLDGTLLNTLDDLVDSVNYSLTQLNYPTKTTEEVRSFVGNGISMLIKRALPKGYSEEDFEKCIKIFQNHYIKNMNNKTRPYDKIIELLEELRNLNIALAIVSNKFQAGVDELRLQFFNKYIKVGVGNREDLQPKPAPDSVFVAMKELNLDVHKDIIYYIGDSEVDILTAHNSNLPIIAVTWGFRNKEELIGAEIIVDKPQDILKFVKNTLII